MIVMEESSRELAWVCLRGTKQTMAIVRLALRKLVKNIKPKELYPSNYVKPISVKYESMSKYDIYIGTLFLV